MVDGWCFYYISFWSHIFGTKKTLLRSGNELRPIKYSHTRDGVPGILWYYSCTVYSTSRCDKDEIRIHSTKYAFQFISNLPVFNFNWWFNLAMYNVHYWHGNEPVCRVCAVCMYEYRVELNVDFKMSSSEN